MHRRLLIRPGAIGDVIVSLPALESLCIGYTEVWTTPCCVPLIRFAAARSIRSTGLDWLEIRPETPPPGLLDALRGFDSIISWYGASRDQFRDTVRRFGLPFAFLPALPLNEATGCEQHASEFYLEQAASLGGQPVAAIPRIVSRRRSVNDGDSKGLLRYGGPPEIVIHPFSGSPRKNWPLARYRELARRLGERWTVGWTAGPEEPLEEAVRFEDLHELAQWLAGVRLFIGNDSGVAHLAAAAGVPVAAIFGPTDDRVWAPRGPLVRVVRPALRPAPVDEIAVSDVLAAVDEILSVEGTRRAG